MGLIEQEKMIHYFRKRAIGIRLIMDYIHSQGFYKICKLQAFLLYYLSLQLFYYINPPSTSR